MFDLLNFQPHLNGIPNAIAARHKFENDWEISVVAGPPNCGLYGNLNDGTYEVAIIRPNGNMTDDVNGWNTKQEVSAMMWVLAQL
jgi:hypothetical protein